MYGIKRVDSTWERCLNDTVRTLRKKLFGLWQQRHAPCGWTMLRCVQHESHHGPIRYDTGQGLHGGDRMKGPYRTSSGITYLEPKNIAALVFDPQHDDTHIHLCSGTIFSIKQTQAEFQILRKELTGR